MDLIINVSKEDYNCLKSYVKFYDTIEGRLLKAIKIGDSYVRPICGFQDEKDREDIKTNE